MLKNIITFTATLITVKVMKNKKLFVESKYKPIKNQVEISKQGIRTSI